MTTSLKDPEIGKLYWVRRFPEPFLSNSTIPLSDCFGKQFRYTPNLDPVLCCGSFLSLTPDGKQFDWGIKVLDKSLESASTFPITGLYLEEVKDLDDE